MTTLKNFSFFALVAGVSFLCGCTRPPQAPNAGAYASADAQIGGSIRIWIDNEDWAKAAIGEFNALHPDVTVDYEITGNSGTRARVALAGPAGVGPDVFFISHGNIPGAVLDDTALAIPADAQRRYSEYIMDSAIASAAVDGVLYAVPMQLENIALFYNKDLLGNTPVPQSFEELIAFAETYNNPQANRYAFRWEVANSYNNYFFLTAFGWKLFGPNMNDFRLISLDTPEVRRGLEFYADMRRIYDVNSADATYDATVAAFQRGEVPFTITGPWSIADAISGGLNFGVAKLPTIAGNQPRCFAGIQTLMVSSYSKNIPASLAFVDYLASVAGQNTMYKTTGKLPAYKDFSLIEGLSDDAYLAGIVAQAAYADATPNIAEVPIMWTALGDLFTFTWDRQLTPSEAQIKAMETYDLQLQMAGKSR